MSYKEELQSLGDAYFNEVYKGKHGQSDKEYADSRSDGGKMISGDSKMSGAEFTHGRRVKADNPGMQPDVGGKTKPKSQGKMDKGTRNDLMYRKANLKKEELGIYSSLGDAYASMYEAKKESKKETDPCWTGYKRKPGTKKFDDGSCVKEEEEYSVSVEDGIALEEGKKECKDGYYYCKDEKKCKKKKKKSSNTTIIVGRGYGGHHHHDHDDDKEDGNEGGGDTGGGDGGGGGE